MIDQHLPIGGNTLTRVMCISHSFVFSKAGRPLGTSKNGPAAGAAEGPTEDTDSDLGAQGPSTQVWRVQLELRALNALAEDFLAVVIILPVAK
jgi:hypothetical protein